MAGLLCIYIEEDHSIDIVGVPAQSPVQALDGVVCIAVVFW